MVVSAISIDDVVRLPEYLGGWNGRVKSTRVSLLGMGYGALVLYQADDGIERTIAVPNWELTRTREHENCPTCRCYGLPQPEASSNHADELEEDEDEELNI